MSSGYQGNHKAENIGKQLTRAVAGALTLKKGHQLGGGFARHCKVSSPETKYGFKNVWGDHYPKD